MLIVRLFIILFGVLAYAMGIQASTHSDTYLSQRLSVSASHFSSFVSTKDFSIQEQTLSFSKFFFHPIPKDIPITASASETLDGLWDYENCADESPCFAKPQASNPHLLDAKAKRHILDGDESGGGHRFGTGRIGKSEFPPTWSDEKIQNEILYIATDPNTLWSIPDARGYVSGEAEREGILIRVIYDSRKQRIVTAYPINRPKNPR
jgi:hypothetical protein